MLQDRPVVWRPTPAYTERSHLKRFMDAHGIASYAELLRRSESDISWFWDAVVKYAGIEFATPYTEVVDLSGGLAWPKWFPGSKINLAHNFLDKWAADPATAARPALLWEGEDGAARSFSFAALNAAASQFANALRSLQVEKGDRVAIYMPMIPETVIAVYGIYKAGAIAVPLFSGFAPDAVALRLNDVEAKAVVTADGYYRGGRAIRLKAALNEALASVPSVTSVVVAQRLGEGTSLQDGRDHLWSDLVDAQSTHFATVAMDAEDPAMVSYSSGTSGKPKGIVHVHGGLAVKLAEVGLFIYDTHPDDVSFMITDFGWMMGQLPLFSAHTVGSPLVIYEGSPLYPHPGRLYELAEKYRISVFGAPATALRLMRTYGEAYRAKADLSSIRLLGHTGEPIDADTWNWYFSWRDGAVPIINGSGGTELFAEAISATVMQPQKPCCLGATPAVGARVVDEQGEPVPPGKPGFLVLTLPQPAQTRGFWRDPNRYLETYFGVRPDLWWHGDMVMVDEEGFWFHLGRADDIIKVAGRRTGPGEVEDAVCAHPAVLEAAVIGVPHPIQGESLAVFVVPKPGAALEPADVAAQVVKSLGKPYEPAAVHLVRDLPRTRTQKVMRRLIRQRYLGEPLGDTASLMNPEALEQIPLADALET